MLLGVARRVLRRAAANCSRALLGAALLNLIGSDERML